MPSRVIAYTSGQNELLSNPYYKLKYHYFKIFEDKKKYEEGEEISDNHRLFFLDYNTNFSVFIANMLLAKKDKKEILKNVLQIQELNSFRITLNMNDLYQRVIPVSKSIAENIEKLKLCATTWALKEVGKFNLLILDYFVDDATRDVFRYHFKTSFNLFKVFYELDIFNLYLVNKATRNLIVNANKTLNISDELPKPDPSRLVFRIEKVEVKKVLEKGKPAKKIFYKSLSDGEHQFNEVVGTVMMMEEEGSLFLMDEPDTHFNPQWRAKFLKTLNFVSAKTINSEGKIMEVRKQELIMTTHSPFVIGDSNKDNVYKFHKVNGEISYDNPRVETYGASVNLLLQEIFERKITISELSNYDLDEFRKELKKLRSTSKIREKINYIKERLQDFGESIEKFDIYSMLNEVEKNIDQKK
ncbi:MAG: restriction system-associated AAA family ATPase [Flavobacterium sp.]